MSIPTKEQGIAATKFNSYARGWFHASGCRPLDPHMAEATSELVRTQYKQGYADGGKARADMLNAKALEFGHVTTILRAQ